MTQHRKPGPDGFTLLELLVALVVLALVLAGLSQGTRVGILALHTEDRLSDRSSELGLVDGMIRRLIELMEPGDELEPAPFVGSSNSMEGITAMPGGGSVRRMRASLFVDRSHRLILRWEPYLRAVALRPPPPPVETELMTHVSQIEVAFWRAASGWTTAWRAPDLPALIRVRLRFPAGDARRWPDIVAAPSMDRR